MSEQEIPTCWKCEYDLRGLQVTDVCPECGTPVWSTPSPAGSNPVEAVSRDARNARNWGIGSLVAFFVCFGPLAVVAAIPAIAYGMRVRAALKTGRLSTDAARGAGVGLVCGWIVVVLSVAWVVAFFLMEAF